MGNIISGPDAPAADSCNGNPALCSRSWSEVTQIGTHNSAFVGPLPSQNQDFTLTEQLDAGIRFLQAQTHDKDGVLTMCHTSCLLLDAGPVESYLSTVKMWMDVNPTEVVTVLLTNPENIPVAEYGELMVKTGLDKLAYIPPKKLALAEWPTLQQLITANTRLVMFMDYHADPSIIPYILDEFSYFFETAFENYDKDFPSCDLDRPSGSNGDGLMYIVNHFLGLKLFDGVYIPHELLMWRTNAPTGAGSIGAQSDLCKGKWNRKPKFVLVDRFNRGNVFPAQDVLNGL